jgi:tetratricopeptide (TPR) repeat protein
MRWGKGVGKWWVILAVVVMFLGSPAGTLKAVTVSFIAERDQTRLAAERAFAEAERLADQKNVDSIRQAIAKYEEAARLYRTLGERGEEAVCLDRIGKMYSALGEKQKALEYYTQALAHHPRCGGSGRRSLPAQQHRHGVRRSRREAEGAGVLHSGAGHHPRRGGSGRGSHDAQQHRRGVLRSRREAEGAGVLHPGAGR